MKRKIVTKVELNKEIYKEFFTSYINSSKLSNALLTIMILFLYMDIYNKNYFLSITYSILIIILILVLPIIKMFLQYHSILEINGGNIPCYQYVFDSEKITYSNNMKKSSNITYNYNQINLVLKSKKLYIFNLNNNENVIALKKDITDEDLNYILSKCNNKKVRQTNLYLCFRSLCLLLAIISLFLI